MAQSLNLLDNVSTFTAAGIPIILKDTRKQESTAGDIVSVYVMAHGGVKLADKAGTLEILTAMMGRGTYRYSREEIDKLAARTGANFGASADLESVSFTIRALKPVLPEVLPLVSEMMRVPLFEQKELDIIKGRYKNALKGELDDPGSKLALLMHRTFYQNHSYYERPSGYVETIDSITRDDLTSALFKTFNKENLTFVVVGPLSKSETSQMVEKYFGSLQKGKRSEEVQGYPRNPHDRVFFDQMETDSAYLMGQFKAPNLAQEDYPALALGMNILQDRMWEEIRTKRSLSYSVHAGISNARINTGYLYMISGKIEEALAIALEEIRKMQIAEVDQDTLNKQVQKMLTSWYKVRETRAGQSAVFATYEGLGIGWEKANSYIGRLEKVTPQQVKDVMTKYLRNITFVVVAKERPNLEESLVKYGFLPKEALKAAATQPTAPAPSSETPAAAVPAGEKPSEIASPEAPELIPETTTE